MPASISTRPTARSPPSKLARQTFTAGVLTDIGSFGASYNSGRIPKKPVLVSSADGVGTKLKVAFLTGRHDTVGEDLVNHCVNDIAVQGAVPLFFLDYFAVGKLDADVAAAVVSGIARGCKKNGCALIGGETAEMPGLYAPGEYDLAGFIVGAAERKAAAHRRSHPRGRRAARRCPPPACTPTAIRWRASCCSRWPATGRRRCCRSGLHRGRRAAAVHRSYLKPIRALMDAGLLRGAAHITGGGITDNTPRMLPEGLAAAIDTASWTIPPMFEVLRRSATFRKTITGARSTWASG